MSSPGRPTLYRRDLCELARNYCLLGATNADLAGFFDVSTRTIDNWIAVHPEFATAVREARAVADAKVARCLYERAVGYEHTMERTVWHLGRERLVSEKVRLPPDTRACTFWLRNRQPQLWGGRAQSPRDEAVDDFALLDAACGQAPHASAHDVSVHDAFHQDEASVPGNRG